MADQNPAAKPGTATYNYTLDKAKYVYFLLEKPADMPDQEWAIVSDEGFRKYLASQLKIAYMSRQEMVNRPR